jgi:hypothetical protein
MKTKYTAIALFLLYITSNCGLAQSGVLAVNSPSQVNSDSTGDLNRLVLTAEVEKASQEDGYVTIPFTLKNNSDEEVSIEFVGKQIDGLAVVDQTGKIRFIQNLHNSLPGNFIFGTSGSSSRITLKPGETTAKLYSKYSLEVLQDVAGRKVFGVLIVGISGADGPTTLYSTPFLIPPALTTPPYNDLGAQNFLSVTPDLTQVYFSGGSFPLTTLESQRANPNYADWIKNGWAWSVSIPLTVSNTSSQDVVVVINDVDFYIAGDESFKQERMQYRRWEYLKASTPILKPGDSISSEPTGRSYITLSWLYRRGYKPGDKIIAMVGGRIPGTNKIFDCYSAPFELPPLPKGQPPIPAGKQ